MCEFKQTRMLKEDHMIIIKINLWISVKKLALDILALTTLVKSFLLSIKLIKIKAVMTLIKSVAHK